MSYNFEFKTIDSQEKAYVLGLFYSDGCISSSKDGKGKKDGKLYYSCRIGLQPSDEQILLDIMRIFPFFKFYKAKTHHYIECTNLNFYNDLLSHGVYPRKSYENKIYLKIPSIAPSLIPHFIRGLYDGDGGYYMYGNLLETFFCSVSKPLIDSLIDYFSQHQIKVNLSIKLAGTGKRKGKQDFYSIRSKNKITALKFRALVFNNPTLYLLRKYTTIMTYNPKSEFEMKSQWKRQPHTQETKDKIAKKNRGKIQTIQQRLNSGRGVKEALRRDPTIITRGVETRRLKRLMKGT